MRLVVCERKITYSLTWIHL